MKAPLSIVSLLLFCGTLLCRAETVTVALTSTSSAQIVEQDAPLSVDVTYQQTGGNTKGHLTANAVAELEVTGLPAGTVTSVLVYMRSNKSAGAGQMSLTLGDRQLLSFNGSFAEWQGTGYSQTYLPFAAIGSWRVSMEDVLHLHIAATENSLYLGQVEIEYTPDPPVIQCAELRCMLNGSVLHSILCEEVAGEGVVLPDMVEGARIVMHNGQTYSFVGWTIQPVEKASTIPFTLSPNSRYYITSPQTVLFALYKLQTDNVLVTDNNLSDGEYALALNTWTGSMALAAGRVASGVVPSELANFDRNEEGHVQWNTASVPEEMRYVLAVRNDSVTLYHPFSNSYLGYNNSGSLSPSERAWAWQAIGKGTVMLYHDTNGSSNKRGLTLKESGNNFVFGEKVLTWSEGTEYLFVFPLTGVSVSATTAVYTTFPAITPLEETSSDNHNPRKELRNGRIVIRSDKATYNLLGMPVND